MDKEEELKFLEALYEIQKASDLGNISMGEAPDKDAEIYQKKYDRAKK